MQAQFELFRPSLDKFGRSVFWKLRERASRRRLFPDAPLCTYMAFDITMYDGQNVMDLPLVMRKELLADILAPLPPQARHVREGLRR